MRTLLTLSALFVLALRPFAQFIQRSVPVWVVNRTDVPLLLSLYLENGDIPEVQPYILVQPGDSSLVIERFRGDWFAWYTYFENEHRTDIQYQAEDSERYRFEPTQGTRPLAHPRRQGHATRTYTPVFLHAHPADSACLLVFDEVSTCRGRCINGEGTQFAYGEYFYNRAWLDRKANGEGRLQSADTLYVGSWRDDRLHGKATITAKDGYREEGRFVNGVREGDFTVTHPDKSRLHFRFRNGVLHGEQVQVIERQDGYGRERRVLWFDNGMETEAPPRDAKRGMYRASPIAR